MTETEILRLSADEMLHMAERHRDLVNCLQKWGDARIDTCLLLDCPHRRKLRETLIEAVATLEQTRKAFKSKQLETLRKKLMGVLAEDA